MRDNGGPSSLVAIVTKQFRQTRIVGADNSESTDTPVTSPFYQRSLLMERLNAAALRIVHGDKKPAKHLYVLKNSISDHV